MALDQELYDAVVAEMIRMGIPVTDENTALMVAELTGILEKHPDTVEALTELSEPDIFPKGLSGFGGLGKYRTRSQRRSDTHKAKVNGILASGLSPEAEAEALAGEANRNKKQKKEDKANITKAITIAAVVVGGAFLLAGGSGTSVGTGVASLVKKAVATGKSIAEPIKSLMGTANLIKSLTGKDTRQLQNAGDEKIDSATYGTTETPVGLSRNQKIAIGGGVAVGAVLLVMMLRR